MTAESSPNPHYSQDIDIARQHALHETGERRHASILYLAQYAIDVAVVDGLVDGYKKRVHASELRGIAFDDTDVDRKIFGDFVFALLQDPRFVDRDEIERRLYGYRPDLEGRTAQPRPKAIVIGTAVCSKKERAEVLQRMELYVQGIYAHASTTRADNNMTPKSPKIIVNNAGLELPRNDYQALKAFMRRDPRFHFTEDGRVTLTALGSTGDSL